VNTRVLLNELRASTNGKVTLATLPDELLDAWASAGFDAVWLMGVWTTGKVGLEMAREHGIGEYKRVLPDLSEADIVGSPYAVKSYAVSSSLGGNKALMELRERLRKRGLGLVLDFVPNHTARDHEWVYDHPEYYVNGSLGLDIEKPEHFFHAETCHGDRVLAYGRDPNFPGWTDTAQLNIRHPGTRAVLLDTLKKIAGMCDGIRCDMAILLLDDVFGKTWGDALKDAPGPLAAGEFWHEAIMALKEESPEFLFVAEAYWDREWDLQQLGFDYTYDKKMYERLAREGAYAVQEHLKAELLYQRRSVRFIENHDEPRAAAAFSSEAWHMAAATVISTVPGMLLIHDGQTEGLRTKLPVQLGRRPLHEDSPRVRSFYERLLAVISHPVFRRGQWKLLQAKAAWHDNHTWTNFLGFWWYDRESGVRLVVVNYAPQSGQCYFQINLDGVDGSPIEFRDLLGNATYVRERQALLTRGMYFDVPGYAAHIFQVLPLSRR
jgi:hypothetical protein